MLLVIKRGAGMTGGGYFTCRHPLDNFNRRDRSARMLILFDGLYYWDGIGLKLSPVGCCHSFLFGLSREYWTGDNRKRKANSDIAAFAAAAVLCAFGAIL